MFDRLRDFHETMRKSKLEAAPDKTYFILTVVKFLSHSITKNKIKPLLNEIEATQEMKRTESKDVMKLPGASNYSKYFPNMHVILPPLYTLLDDDISFH